MSMLKEEINRKYNKNILVQYLVDKEILDFSAVSRYIDRFANARALANLISYVYPI